MLCNNATVPRERRLNNIRLSKWTIFKALLLTHTHTANSSSITVGEHNWDLKQEGGTDGGKYYTYTGVHTLHCTVRAVPQRVVMVNMNVHTD